MPRSERSITVLLAALMLITGIGASGGLAQQPQQPQQRKHFTSQGTVELGGSTTFTATQPVNAGNTSPWIYDFSFLPYAGYFIIDGLELGINPAGVNVQSSGDSTAVQLRVLLAPAYNFHTGTMVTPFVEGLAGITSASLIHSGSTTSVSGFTFGGRAGIKAAIVERGLLTIGIQFLRITLNKSGASSRNGSNELAVSAGWTVWL
jgi:hypothetical protein